jgi:hypothetical protein
MSIDGGISRSDSVVLGVNSDMLAKEDIEDELVRETGSGISTKSESENGNIEEAFESEFEVVIIDEALELASSGDVSSMVGTTRSSSTFWLSN